MCPSDPLDTAFGEEGFCEDLARGDVSSAPDMESCHAEVAQFVFVGQKYNLSPVTYLVSAQLKFEIDNVFEGCSFAGATAMAGSNQKTFLLSAFHSLDHLQEYGRGGRRMFSRTY